MSKIHSSAIIDPSAKIADDVTIGPFCVIGADVEIGSGTSVGPHVVINGPTTIGCDNKIYQFASLGEDPQDKKYAGEPTRLEIGDRNTIREFCTFNRGTTQDKGITRVGNDNWIMAYVHLAHDVMVGSNTILANNVTLAGHVKVGDYAILGGYTKVHQFCWIGAHSFCAFDTGLGQDLPPYILAAGSPAVPRGINSEGLKRRGFTAEGIRGIKQAYRALYRSNLKLVQAIEQIEELAAEQDAVQPLLDFLKNPNRGIIR
jgi:UDP-N-acetylglucosamine acyltransferase